MSKVAVLAVLSSFERTYSVAGVALSQLELLSKHGHELVFITTDDFDDHDKLPLGVEVRTYPRFTAPFDELVADVEFETYVNLVGRVLAEHLKDCTTCITHDVAFLDSFVPVNWAARKAAARLPELWWLHWMHSAPSSRPRSLPYPKIGRYSEFPNSEMVYLNHTDVPRVAEMFCIPQSKVRVVHNWCDPISFFSLHPLSIEIMDQTKLLSRDFVCVYPTRLTPAKQPEKALKLLSYVEKLGFSVLLVLCNSYSNAETEKEYAQKLYSQALKLGLDPSSLCLTSTVQSRWCVDSEHNIELGVPQEVISDLFRLSDLFILPSLSEACSLILLEAAISKNCLVLNEDLWSMFEFGGHKTKGPASDKAIYMSFGSVLRPVTGYQPNEVAWFQARAKELVDFLQSDPAMRSFRYVRKHHNPDWIYHNQIAPLLR